MYCTQCETEAQRSPGSPRPLRRGIRLRLKLRRVLRLIVFLAQLPRKLQKRERERRLLLKGHRDSVRDRRLGRLHEGAEILLPVILAEERRAETVGISDGGATVIVPSVACKERYFVLGQFELR